MKLFPKLAGMVLTLLAASVLALCASFYIAEQCSIRQQAQDERRALLQNLVHITREALVSGDDLLLVKYTRWLQRWNPAVVSLSVVSPRGEVLAHSEPTRIGQHTPVSPPHELPHLQKEPVLLQTQPVSLGHRWVATVSAGFSEKQLEASIRDRTRALQRRLALIAFGACFAGVGVSFLLAHSWAKPIGLLSSAAQRIGQGKYQCDLESMSKRKDEIGILARAFGEMARALEKLDTMKEDFVSAVTHELRSPLGAVESYIYLIQDELRAGVPATAWPSYLERMRLNTRRLNRFVSDLLDVAALERGRVTLTCVPTQLNAVIDDILLLFEAQLAEKKLVCRKVVPSHAIRLVSTDPEKIRQVLVNLISNAIKFTPESGSLLVGLEDDGQSSYVQLYVQDSGIGIAKEDQNRIFNKFEQVGRARTRVKGPKGTGLGLAISKNLITAHQGTLSVQSDPGQGSRFTITLPVFRDTV